MERSGVFMEPVQEVWRNRPMRRSIPGWNILILERRSRTMWRRSRTTKRLPKLSSHRSQSYQKSSRQLLQHHQPLRRSRRLRRLLRLSQLLPLRRPLQLQRRRSLQRGRPQVMLMWQKQKVQNPKSCKRKRPNVAENLWSQIMQIIFGSGIWKQLYYIFPEIFHSSVV